ncbi:MAG TPA: hypothetical protein VE377_21630 [Candidatus Dormibacteraeota bacterium]|nr:hypothetical protein [Candidatus Dormibacteraeota bacterium]
MTIPEQSDPGSQQRIATLDDRRRIHVAFVCYAVLGLGVTLFGAAMTFSDKQTQAGWAFLLFANLSLPVILAFVISIIYTVKARHYRPLLALFVIHILFLAAIVLVMWSQSAEGASEIPVDVAILSYGVFFTAVSVWWFVSGRRRMVKVKS